MAQGVQRAVPGDLDAVLQRVERWRATRLKRGVMPEDLWSEAMAMAARHGVWVVSQVLRVNYESLKARIGRAGSARPTGEKAVGVSGACGPAFVELRAPDASSSWGEAATVVVELSSPDGARLVIKAPGGAGLDLRGLADGFWRRGA